MKNDFESFLTDLLSQPTAPFRERHVRRWLSTKFTEARVPFFEDPIGNVVVGVASKKEYLAKIQKKTSEPARLFIAHMDHPGFHGVRWLDEKKLFVKWFGGSPTQHLEGAKVWLADDAGWAGEGRLSKVKMVASKGAVKEGAVTLLKSEARRKTTLANSLYGGFGFRKPVWKQGKLVYTKAADDLIGAGSIAWLAIQLQKKKSPLRNNFIGLLSRAEEVGFIGTIGHLDLGWLAQAERPVVCVSLETSRTLPGAIVGKGPVVRLGDKATVFDPGAIEVLTSIAAKKLPRKYQRRIMDGGTCEATAATTFGIRSLGISVPLGNYHNQSFEGGPDSRGKLGPAPEFVHSDDIEGMYVLCEALVDKGLPWNRPWEQRQKTFGKYLKDSKRLLKL